MKLVREEVVSKPIYTTLDQVRASVGVDVWDHIGFHVIAMVSVVSWRRLFKDGLTKGEFR